MVPCLLGNTFNVTLREQCHPLTVGLRKTLFPNGYIECVAQHTGHHLYSVWLSIHTSRNANIIMQTDNNTDHIPFHYVIIQCEVLCSYYISKHIAPFCMKPSMKCINGAQPTFHSPHNLKDTCSIRLVNRHNIIIHWHLLNYLFNKQKPVKNTVHWTLRQHLAAEVVVRIDIWPVYIPITGTIALSAGFGREWDLWHTPTWWGCYWS